MITIWAWLKAAGVSINQNLERLWSRIWDNLLTVGVPGGEMDPAGLPPK